MRCRCAMSKNRGWTRPTTPAPAQSLNGSPAALRRGANENPLRGALVMAATVAMTMTMAIMAAEAGR